MCLKVPVNMLVTYLSFSHQHPVTLLLEVTGILVIVVFHSFNHHHAEHVDYITSCFPPLVERTEPT